LGDLFVFRLFDQLLWVSLAGNGNIPALSDDGLTIILVMAVVAPMIVYIVGLIYEQVNN